MSDLQGKLDEMLLELKKTSSLATTLSYAIDLAPVNKSVFSGSMNLLAEMLEEQLDDLECIANMLHFS